MNEEGAERLRELVKKARAGAPPRPHDVRTHEHFEQCVECQEWGRVLEASIEKVETEAGMIPGELSALLLIALATKANALAGPPPAGHLHAASFEERKQCPECQEWDKAHTAAFEKLRDSSPEELLQGELAFDPDYFTKMREAMLPVMDVMKKAIESGELPLPPSEHRQTHRSSQELR